MQDPKQKKSFVIVIAVILAVASIFGGLMVFKKQSGTGPTSDSPVGQSPVRVIPEAKDASVGINGTAQPGSGSENSNGGTVGATGETGSGTPGAVDASGSPVADGTSGEAGKGYPVVAGKGDVAGAKNISGGARQPASVGKVEGTQTAPGAPNIPSAIKGTEAGKVADKTPSTPTIEKVADGCFKMTFKHQKMASHDSGEACTMHKNLLTLQGERINHGSVCVRVNGTPVKYEWAKGKSNQVMLAPIAGPKAVITAQYCTGNVMCGEDCKIPKDSFMEAIGAGDDSGADAPVVQWDSTDPNKKQAKEEAAVDQEVESFKKELAEHNPAGESKTFSGWTVTETPLASCKQNQVTGGASVGKLARPKNKS